MKNRRQVLIALWVFLLIIGFAIFLWTIRSVPFNETIIVFSSLGLWEIAAFLAVNVLILVMAPLRWWLVLRAQGYPVPYLTLSRYRFEGSAVSYFTPGQNFGGEPLQVIALRKHHKVPGSTALASVTLDRAIEIFGNFAVLALGITFVLATGLFSVMDLRNALLIALVVLALPSLYLTLLWIGIRPISRLLQRFKGGVVVGIRSAEGQLSNLIRKKPVLFIQGLACSAFVWAALFFEFWLALNFLGLGLEFSQLVVVVTAGRIALLAPTPGALGALEASQMLAVEALGFDPAYGLSLGLLIRARDILFAAAGIVLGGFTLR
jgi:uncharacterized protein (TIRG00374 family)